MVDCLRSKDALLFEEIGIRHGLVRVDFLVVNGFCHGYEIKSRPDAIRRLNQNAPIYCSALDRLTLVITDVQLTQLVVGVPTWWGIELVVQRKSGFTLSSIRDAGDNPNVDKGAIVKFLWRSEALAALSELNAATGVRSKPRRAVYHKLAECAGLPFIRKQIHFHLQQRKIAQAATQ